MTLRKLIEQLSNVKDELQDKEIVMKAENGLLLEPKIKFILKYTTNFEKDAKNVDKIILTAQD